jgi:hypothetical protein
MSLTHVDPHVSEIVMVWIQSGDLLMIWIQISPKITTILELREGQTTSEPGPW